MNDRGDARGHLRKGNDRITQTVDDTIQRVEDLIAEALLANLVPYAYGVAVGQCPIPAEYVAPDLTVA